ncbi:MAG TPA: gluconate 2-dehydrogenase subunit 3 family protein [Acidobacteriota bacterium]|nr:gluconate 2-dehydrogenase subunit 3 family protein [Acidobacteriota bacterium]
MAKEFSRRSFLQQSAKSSVLALSVGSIWAEVQKAGSTKPRSILSVAYREKLRAAADEIIPAAGGMPAASQVGAVSYIEVVLAKVPELKKQVQAALNQLDTRAQSLFKQSFAKVSSAERVELLRAFQEQSERPGPAGTLYASIPTNLFATLRDLVYEAYYTSPKVWPLLGYKLYPTNDAGPDMKPFDDTILAEIRKRPKNYREVK